MDEIHKLMDYYIKNNKYISCLEELYVLFEKNNISCSEQKTIMTEIYRYNEQIHGLEERRSYELDKIKNHKSMVIKPIEEMIVEAPKTKKNIESLQCDVTPYMEKIKNFSSIGELENILPNRDSEQFDNVIDMIVVKLYHEKVELINFIHEQQQVEKNIYQFFDDELEDLDFRIDTLLDYKNNMNLLEGPVLESSTNKIIFLKNSFGEPIIFSDIKGYDEYYDSFLELINLISIGDFRRSRVFTNNGKIVDMMEVKGFKTRILLSRLKDNIFVVLSAFVKKCDTDLRHRNLLQNVSYMYQNQKETLINLVDNEQFLEQEKMYLDELVEKFKEKRKGNVK